MIEQKGSASFEKTTLENGVRVVTETIPSVRSISVGVWIFAGSRDETREESGISHFIEHMVFKGTQKRRMHHIAQRMESVGGYLNAFTAKEYTCYYARALDEHLARAVDTVSDLVLSPNLPTKELEKEKDVVLEEMKMYEDNPEDLIFDKFEAAVYADHELGRPIIGYPDTVSAFTREQLVDYMERRYTPNRIVLAVAGNARHEHVVRLARSAFAATRRTSPDVARIPVEGYESVQIVDYRPIQQAHLVIGARGMDVHNPDRAGLSVLNTILGGGMSSRLNQNIRERYGFCYNIYSFTNLHSDSGDLGVYMGTDANKIDRARKLIVRELEKLVEKPVSGRTLSQAKNQVRGSIMLGLESMSNRMMRLGRQELYFERFMSLDEINRDIEKVSPEDVQRIARDMFDKETFSSVVLLPQN
ncbi:MAG: pitrilysin family protein [Rhodothermales bacterium]